MACLGAAKCKGAECMVYIGVVLYLVCRQLRFSLYSGAVTTKGIGCSCIPYLFLVSGSVEYPMSYAYCLVSCIVVWRCSCSSACIVLCLMQLSLSEDLEFCSLFYLGYFCIALWDSLSGLCALWDSLSSFPSL